MHTPLVDLVWHDPGALFAVLSSVFFLCFVWILSYYFVLLHVIHVLNVWLFWNNKGPQHSMTKIMGFWSLIRPLDHFECMSTFLNYKITLTSWNVRDLGNNIKCGKVYSHLNLWKADILFLQETHTIKDTDYKLKPRWISLVYHAPFRSRGRGVAILFHNTIPLLLKSKIINPNGRFIFISGYIN